MRVIRKNFVRFVGLGALLATTLLSSNAVAELQKVGVVGAANQTLSATDEAKASRKLELGKDIYFNDTLSTDASGNAQLMFIDKSALTIGPNASVVIDKFVYNPASGSGELTMRGTKGAFRFIGGALSKKQDVKFKTPVGTIGIRGGIAIVEIDPKSGATNATFLYGQKMTFQNQAGQIQETTNRGFAIGVQTPTSKPTMPIAVDPKVLMQKEQQYFKSSAGETGGAAKVPTNQDMEKPAANIVVGANKPVDNGTPPSGDNPPPAGGDNSSNSSSGDKNASGGTSSDGSGSSTNKDGSTKPASDSSNSSSGNSGNTSGNNGGAVTNGDGTKPAADGSTPPAGNGTAANNPPPAGSGTASNPPASGTNPPPATGTAPQPSTGTYTPPVAGTNPQPSTGTYTPPATGAYPPLAGTTPPVTGANPPAYTPPAAYTPPSYTAPVYTPPATYVPPVYTPPVYVPPVTYTPPPTTNTGTGGTGTGSGADLAAKVIADAQILHDNTFSISKALGATDAMAESAGSAAANDLKSRCSTSCADTSAYDASLTAARVAAKTYIQTYIGFVPSQVAMTNVQPNISADAWGNARNNAQAAFFNYLVGKDITSQNLTDAANSARDVFKSAVIAAMPAYAPPAAPNGFTQNFSTYVSNVTSIYNTDINNFASPMQAANHANTELGRQLFQNAGFNMYRDYIAALDNARADAATAAGVQNVTRMSGDQINASAQAATNAAQTAFVNFMTSATAYNNFNAAMNNGMGAAFNNINFIPPVDRNSLVFTPPTVSGTTNPSPVVAVDQQVWDQSILTARNRFFELVNNGSSPSDAASTAFGLFKSNVASAILTRYPYIGQTVTTGTIPLPDNIFISQSQFYNDDAQARAKYNDDVGKLLAPDAAGLNAKNLLSSLYASQNHPYTAPATPDPNQHIAGYSAASSAAVSESKATYKNYVWNSDGSNNAITNAQNLANKQYNQSLVTKLQASANADVTTNITSMYPYYNGGTGTNASAIPIISEGEMPGSTNVTPALGYNSYSYTSTTLFRPESESEINNIQSTMAADKASCTTCQYVGWGVWKHLYSADPSSNTAVTGVTANAVPYVYGVTTPANYFTNLTSQILNNSPQTYSANYNGFVMGNINDGAGNITNEHGAIHAGLSFYGGSLTIQQGALTGNLGTLNFSNLANMNVTNSSYNSLLIPGFSGGLYVNDGSAANYSSHTGYGTVNGMFFGPNAENIGGSLNNITSTTTNGLSSTTKTGGGVFIGTK